MPNELTDQQRRWVEQAADRVKALARSLAPRIPHVAEDELVSAGYEGLVAAALRYDPSAGVPFAAFAHYRVRGAMLDAARKAAPAVRRRARALRALEATQALLERAAKRVPAPDLPDPRSLQERVAAAAELVAQATTAVLLSKAGPADPDGLEQDGADTETLLLRAESRQMLQDALASSSPDDRALLHAIYFRGLSMHEYAASIGKSTSTISRHHARALDRLSKRLRRHLG